MSGGPLIGVSTYLDEASWGVWRQPAALIPYSYVACVSRAGGVAVLLPPQAGDAADALAMLDGLLLTGGPDLDPAAYGQQAHAATGKPNRARDEWEFALLNGALRLDLPVLAVCRGMELLNVARGGELTQHLPDRVGGTAHQPAPATFGRQTVRVRPASGLARILGPELRVNCYHHQAVSRVAEGLLPAAWCGDETVEAVEMPDRTFVYGVQWHPETDPADTRLFDALVEQARKARTDRGSA